PARRAHARDADAGADGAARCGARAGVRPAVPDVHDRAPSRRPRDGRGAGRESGRRTGPGHLPVRDGRGRGPAGRDLRHAEHAQHARHHRRERIVTTGYAGRGPAAATGRSGEGCFARALTGLRHGPARAAGGPERGSRRGSQPRAARRGPAIAAMVALGFGTTIAPLAAQTKAADPRADTVATLDDPRVGLGAGAYNNAGIALWNMRLVSYAPKPAEFDSTRGLTYINSDLAFRGNLVYQG